MKIIDRVRINRMIKAKMIKERRNEEKSNHLNEFRAVR